MNIYCMYIHIMIFETEYLQTLHILHTLIIYDYVYMDRIAHAVDTIPSTYSQVSRAVSLFCVG